MLKKLSINKIKKDYNYLFLLDDKDDLGTVNAFSSFVIPNNDAKLILNSKMGNDILEYTFKKFVLEYLKVDNISDSIINLLNLKDIKKASFIDNLFVYEISSDTDDIKYYVMHFANDVLLSNKDIKFINDVWDRFVDSKNISYNDKEKLKNDIVSLKTKYSVEAINYTLNKMNQLALAFNDSKKYTVYNKLLLLISTIENGGF